MSDLWTDADIARGKDADELTALRSQVSELRADLEVARDALRPFAEYRGSDEFLKSAEDDGICAGASFRAGQYRAARAALLKDPNA